MDKKSKDLLEWEKKLKEEEEILAKSKRNLSERKQKLNEAERNLEKRKKELEDMQKNMNAMRMNLDAKEEEVSALAKKLRDVTKVENNQGLLEEYGVKNVFHAKSKESGVKLKEKVESFEQKGLKKNVAATTRFEVKKGQWGSEKGNILDEGDEDLGIFTRPPEAHMFEEYFPRHDLE